MRNNETSLQRHHRLSANAAARRAKSHAATAIRWMTSADRLRDKHPDLARKSEVIAKAYVSAAINDAAEAYARHPRYRR